MRKKNQDEKKKHTCGQRQTSVLRGVFFISWLPHHLIAVPTCNGVAGHWMMAAVTWYLENK
jgi:hypothetical protein